MAPQGDAQLHEWHARARRRVGDRLADRWRIEAILGVGGTSTVFAASDDAGRSVAIKILHSEYSWSEVATARLAREALIANELSADGAVAVLESGIDGGESFLVMERLEGETLSAKAAASGGSLAVPEALRIVEALLTTLAAAHARGIVHRDVKPQNVFITTDGAVRLLDFGLARGDELHARPDGITRSGATLGTPAFMAPEQARGRSRELDARTDVWCVGATLFAILTGRHVHEGETIGESLVMAGSLPAPPIEMHLPRLPSRLSCVIARSLAFRPEARFPDAGAMLASLREARERVALGDTEIPVAPTQTTLPEDPVVVPSAAPGGRRSRSTAWLLGAAVLSLAAAATAAWTRAPQTRDLRVSSGEPLAMVDGARADAPLVTSRAIVGSSVPAAPQVPLDARGEATRAAPRRPPRPSRENAAFSSQRPGPTRPAAGLAAPPAADAASPSPAPSLDDVLDRRK